MAGRNSSSEPHEDVTSKPDCERLLIHRISPPHEHRVVPADERAAAIRPSPHVHTAVERVRGRKSPITAVR